MSTESSSKRIALVLGAGGARGLAHIGVIEVLRERGHKIVAVAGSSMGALVGGIYAAGRLEEYTRWASALERSDVVRLLDFAFGHPGLFKGDRVIAVLRDLIGSYQIESLSIPFTAVATDVQRQREVWLQHGPLFDAIRASIAIPMVFTPYRIDDRELVDGGLLSPMPMAATRMSSADWVVAVDLNAHMHLTENGKPSPVTAVEKAQAGDDAPQNDSLRQRIGGFLDGFIEKRNKPAISQPGIVDLMSQALDTMQAQIARMQLALDPPDLLIRVPHDSCAFYEFWRAKELIEIGRNAAEHALATLALQNGDGDMPAKRRSSAQGNASS
jgi:NTE family protein